MRVLGLVDFSDATSVVVKAATDLARAYGAALVLLHVATPDAEEVDGDGAVGPGGGRRAPEGSRAGVAAGLRRLHRAMRVLARERERLGVPTVGWLARSPSTRGNPVAKILWEVERLRPDLVVVGSHGHGALHELLLGSVSRAVVRRSRCPVLVVPSRRTAPASPAPLATL